MLKVSGLSASYDGIVALKGVELDIAEGEMVALVGPNGAGKSTLLNCISGVVRRTAGTVAFAGQDISSRAPHLIARSGLLQVPEGRLILTELTVEENLLLGMLALGDRPQTYSLEAVFELFPILSERRWQKAGTLSGGEQQMLAIGRALMGAPRLLLLDEPSLGLAPLMTEKVFDALALLNRAGLSIFLVEQNARRALAATSRAYILEQGRIVQQGASSSLLADPAVIGHFLGGDLAPSPS
ncbi:MAG: ABC transporter ATP-binding protein [Rhizobiaceae bacterium]